jgi:hypothetical protein
MRRLSTTTVLATMALLAMGCQKMAVDGEVVNARGEPLVGASVTAMGTQCQATVNEKGTFALACVPDRHRLVVHLEGYTSEEILIDAQEHKRYDVGKTVLVKIPEAKGLFLFSEKEYVAMKPGRLGRNHEPDGEGYHRSFCLDEARSEANKVSAGVQGFFDYEHEGWKPFRLDADGCAYKDSKDSSGKYTVHYREKAKFQGKQLNRGKSVILMELKKGQYFIADWKGFFQPPPGEKHTYTGYWVVAE